MDVFFVFEILGYYFEDNGFNFVISVYLLVCIVLVWLFGVEVIKVEYFLGLFNGMFIVVNVMIELVLGFNVFCM